MKNTLKRYAETYETTDFLTDDPSKFMHMVTGDRNQEVMAFIASSLSYGSRKQFLPKIQMILDWSEGEVYDWVKSGLFRSYLQCDDDRCFYRLYTYSKMYQFLEALQQLLIQYGTLKDYVRLNATDGFTAVAAICRYFADAGIEGIIPKNTDSACKRVCMFLRWMVRKDSPVDLGLWADIIDRRTLIIPLDTHVLQQSQRLGLVTSKAASMNTAVKITKKLLEFFPDDPLKGDFALFGYGVNSK